MLEDVGFVDPQVALRLLRQCGSTCKMVHLACSTPPSLMADALQMFDNDIHEAFAECTAVDAFGNSWEQAQLSLRRGGLGLPSLSHHSAAAYISSVSASEQCVVSMSHLLTSLNLFNALIPSADAITLDDIVSSPCHQHALSSKIENSCFLTIHPCLTELVCYQFLPPMLRPGFQFFPHQVLTCTWTSGIPSSLKMAAGYGFGSGPQLHLLSKSCLGSFGPPCYYLQAWGRCGFKLHDVFVECCRQANVSAQVEVGVALGKTNTTPDRQMFWSPTGLLGSQLHLILPLPHR